MLKYPRGIIDFLYSLAEVDPIQVPGTGISYWSKPIRPSRAHGHEILNKDGHMIKLRVLIIRWSTLC